MADLSPRRALNRVNKGQGRPCEFLPLRAERCSNRLN